MLNFTRKQITCKFTTRNLSALIGLLVGVTISGCNLGATNRQVNNTIVLNNNGDSVRIAPQAFFNTTNGIYAPQYPTILALRYESATDSLILDFNIQNDPYVEQNQYNINNTELYQQEVLEIFIAAGDATPTTYTEIEVNPNNALFSAYIYNPSGRGGESETLFNGESQGITVAVSKNSNSWSGSLVFPLSIAGNSSSIYRLNFFRVVSKFPQDVSSLWSCNPITCEYLAWQPTYSGAIPAFHLPAYFGKLIINK
ncbi:MAG: carbohydrate-binding family 9-like protein [Burkholderiales bacterium]|nr:carbohydrate-binding family 9-like protein [Burkholderiales bacterium]